ncbi:MAG: hypothetical protein WD512_16815 [Candidatus Paceibacterota bacterium]
MKTYRVNVYYQYDKTLTVKAKNSREAKKIAHQRIANMKIGHKAIDKQMTDPEEYPSY